MVLYPVPAVLGLLRWLENEDEDGCQYEIEDEDKAKDGCRNDKESKNEDVVDRKMKKSEIQGED